MEANFKETGSPGRTHRPACNPEPGILWGSKVYHGRVVGMSAGTGGDISCCAGAKRVGQLDQDRPAGAGTDRVDPAELAEHPLIGLLMRVSIDTHDRDGSVESRPAAPRVAASRHRCSPISLRCSPTKRRSANRSRPTAADERPGVLATRPLLGGPALLRPWCWARLVWRTSSTWRSPTSRCRPSRATLRSYTQGTWVITSYAVSGAIMLPMTGWLAQRFGQVRMFVAATLLFTLASLMCGIAFSFRCWWWRESCRARSAPR